MNLMRCESLVSYSRQDGGDKEKNYEKTPYFSTMIQNEKRYLKS